MKTQILIRGGCAYSNWCTLYQKGGVLLDKVHQIRC